MPEEINRVLTDSISDLLFCTEQSGVDNLLREGVPKEKVFLVGNVMIDTLLQNRAQAEASKILESLDVESRGYATVTLHRPSNVDDAKTLGGILNVLDAVQKDMPVIFPVHPRTSKMIQSTSALKARVDRMPGLRMIDPVGYLDFLKLLAHSRIVLTDSGGVQEETTILKVPCLTMRENTERPVTAEIGSNRIVGADPARILPAYREIMDGRGPKCGIPPLWDGRAAERIVEIMVRELDAAA
jgi:UDP-N-acetylglucosamine 2-epimerase (non-hydrolysing)